MDMDMVMEHGNWTGGTGTGMAVTLDRQRRRQRRQHGPRATGTSWLSRRSFYSELCEAPSSLSSLCRRRYVISVVKVPVPACFGRFIQS